MRRHEPPIGGATMKSRAALSAGALPILLLALLAGLGLAALAADPSSPTGAAEDRGASRAVVSTAWLAENLKAPGLVVLDARPGVRDYVAAHIPGAQPLGVENLRSSDRGVPGQLFPGMMIETIGGRLGITSGSPVVVYGAENDPDAAFVASALRMHGLSRVSILDGGLARWMAEKRPTDGHRKVVSHARLDLAPDPDGLATFEDVRRAVRDKSAIVLDVRPPEQFEAGRISGAVHRFWKKDLRPEGDPAAGLLKDAPALEREYAALGVTRDCTVIVYCNTGHMASEVFYTLRYYLDIPGARLYDGSWLEWAMMPDAPQEKGPDAGMAPPVPDAPGGAGNPPPAEALDRARKAADDLTSALLSHLMIELANGGPANAVKVCAEVAPSIAASTSSPTMLVRRVSLKVRNPADAPDAYERAILTEFERLHGTGSLPRESQEARMEDGKRVLRYLRPVIIGQPCLACHGDPAAIDPKVRAILAERYPADVATGYKAGDLRGAVSVRMMLD